MAAHNYWRVAISAGTSSVVHFREVFFLDANGFSLATSTLSATVIASGGSTPAEAFDGEVESGTGYWTSASNQYPQWIGLQYAQAIDVTAVKIKLFESSSNLPSANSLTLEYSDDGSTWTAVSGMVLTGVISSGAMVLLAPSGWAEAAAPLKFLDMGYVMPVGLTALPAPLASPALDMTLRVFGDRKGAPDYYGDGFIADTVKERPNGGAADGSADYPVHRKVRLHREMDGLLIAETWSHPSTGAYRFDQISRAYVYTVLSYDHAGIFRAVVADRITPEAMP